MIRLENSMGREISIEDIDYNKFKKLGFEKPSVLKAEKAKAEKAKAEKAKAKKPKGKAKPKDKKDNK